jgi:hypothetical protein
LVCIELVNWSDIFSDNAFTMRVEALPGNTIYPASFTHVFAPVDSRFSSWAVKWREEFETSQNVLVLRPPFPSGPVAYSSSGAGFGTSRPRVFHAVFGRDHLVDTCIVAQSLPGVELLLEDAGVVLSKPNLAQLLLAYNIHHREGAVLSTHLAILLDKTSDGVVDERDYELLLADAHCTGWQIQ